MPAAASEGAPAFPTKASPGLLSCIKHRAHHPSAIPALLDNKLRGKQPPLQCLKELSSVLCFIQTQAPSLEEEEEEKKEILL